jgi:hypothetical protein
VTDIVEPRNGAWLVGTLLIAPVAAFFSLCAWFAWPGAQWGVLLEAGMTVSAVGGALLAHMRRGGKPAIAWTGIVTAAATFVWFWVELLVLLILYA